MVGSTFVPNEFSGIGVTPDGKTAIVTEVNEFGSLFFVDVVNQILFNSRLLSLGDEPIRLAITDDGNYAYVVDPDLGGVFVVDVPNRLVDRIELQGAIGGEPYDIVLTSDGTRALIVDGNDGWIFLVDVTSSPWTILDAKQEVGIFAEPETITLSPIDSLAIVANSTDESVSFVNFAGDVLNIEETIKVEGTPFEVAFSADGTKAVATLNNTSLVAIIDVNSRSVSKTLKRFGGRAPKGVAIVSSP